MPVAVIEFISLRGRYPEVDQDRTCPAHAQAGRLEITMHNLLVMELLPLLVGASSVPVLACRNAELDRALSGTCLESFP